MILLVLPIGHDQGVRRIPWVTWSIIALCTVMQIYSTATMPSDEQLLQMTDEQLFDTIPILKFGYVTGSGFGLDLLASAFVHDGWFHLVGNMLFLWLAGSAVEDRWGHFRFALFYLVGAAASTYAFEATHSGDPTILVGASGAVSATMGAFLVHFHRTEITFWYFWLFRAGTFRWPAWLALPWWLADQFLWAYLTHSGSVTGIAYAAHIGGFAFGFAVAFVMRRFLPPTDDDEDAPVFPKAQVAGGGVKATPPDRYQQLVTAIEARDVGTMRTLSSRTILDLARANEDQKIVELYNAISAKMEHPPLTDGAFAAAAMAADRLGHDKSFIAIAEAAIAEHPGSTQMPKVMWRLAEHRRNAGELDAAIELLRTIAVRFPRDPLNAKAREALDSRGIDYS